MKIAMLLPDNRDELRRYSDPDPYFGPAPSALLGGLDSLGECEVHVISCVQQSVRAPERIGQRTYYHALEVGKAGWLRGGYLGCVLAIRRRLHRLNPDVVHGQGTERFAGMGAAYCGRPSLITIHGNMRALAKTLRSRPFSFHWLTARLEGVCLRRASGVICNSAYTEGQVRDVARRVWRIGNALLPCFFASPKHVLENKGPPLLLNVGTIAAHKGQLELLAWASALHRKGFRFELCFVGASDRGSAYVREFLERLEEQRREGYVRYLDWCAPEAMVELMDRAQAMVHTPLEESFGLVVAEALARGLKLFAFATGGVADVASGVGDAILVPTGDWAGLGEAFSAWLREGSPRGGESSERMAARFHPQKIARRHLEVYRALLESAAAEK